MRVRPLVDVVAQLSACASSAQLLGLAGERAGSVRVCVSPSAGRLSLINVCVRAPEQAHAHDCPSPPPTTPNTPEPTLRVKL